MSDNIFQKGALVQLETSVWTGRRKVSSSQLIDNEHRAETAQLAPEAFGAHKKLVDGAALNKVRGVAAKMRTYLYSTGLPFPLRGADFIPTGMIPTVEKKLTELKVEFDAAVTEFVAAYPAAREAMRDKLGALYSDQDYPANIAQQFGVSWQYVTLNPAGATQLVDAGMVEAERAKFNATMNEAHQIFTAELRNRFAVLIDHVAERLTGEGDGGKPKIFKASLIGNLQDFMATFSAMNITGDTALETLVSKARELIESGVTAEGLREDKELRAHVAAKMAEVQTALDGMMVDRPTRKLRVLKVDPAASVGVNDAASPAA